MTASLALGFLISFLLGILLINSSFVQAVVLNWRDDLRSAQALHAVPTPRLGGVAVLAGFVVALTLLPPGQVQTMMLLLAAALPVVLAGALEDLGFLVTPLGRLAAASASAMLAMALLGVWIPPSGIPGVDAAFAFPLFATAFTLVWVAGICHGFNLIDGVNGLAGGLSLVIAGALAFLSVGAGQDMLSFAALALMAALAGFLALNWPHGRIFLGDAGAYGLGFLLVWMAILLAWSTPAISAASLALMFFWPVADTFLAIYRRRRTGRRFDMPDRLHFHQMVYRLLSRLLAHLVAPVWINSLTGLVVLIVASMPVVTAVILAGQPYLALAAWLVYAIAFVASYRAGVALLSSRRLRRPPAGAAASAQVSPLLVRIFPRSPRNPRVAR